MNCSTCWLLLNRSPPSASLRSPNKKKSKGERSGLYGGCSRAVQYNSANFFLGQGCSMRPGIVMKQQHVSGGETSSFRSIGCSNLFQKVAIIGRIDGFSIMEKIDMQNPFVIPKNRRHHLAGWRLCFCLHSTFLVLPSPLLTGPLRFRRVMMAPSLVHGHYAMQKCITFILVACQECFTNLNTSIFLFIAPQLWYPSGSNFSILLFIFWWWIAHFHS